MAQPTIDEIRATVASLQTAVEGFMSLASRVEDTLTLDIIRSQVWSLVPAIVFLSDAKEILDCIRFMTVGLSGDLLALDDMQKSVSVKA